MCKNCLPNPDFFVDCTGPIVLGHEGWHGTDHTDKGDCQEQGEVRSGFGQKLTPQKRRTVNIVSTLNLIEVLHI